MPVSWFMDMPNWEFTAWQIYLGVTGLPDQRRDIRCGSLSMRVIEPWLKRGARPRWEDVMPLRDPWEQKRVHSGSEMWREMLHAKAQNNAQTASKLRREGWH